MQLCLHEQDQPGDPRQADPQEGAEGRLGGEEEGGGGTEGGGRDGIGFLSLGKLWSYGAINLIVVHCTNDYVCYGCP